MQFINPTLRFESDCYTDQRLHVLYGDLLIKDKKYKVIQVLLWNNKTLNATQFQNISTNFTYFYPLDEQENFENDKKLLLSGNFSIYKDTVVSLPVEKEVQP